jgi:hypothetical protein
MFQTAQDELNDDFKMVLMLINLVSLDLQSDTWEIAENAKKSRLNIPFDTSPNVLLLMNQTVFSRYRLLAYTMLLFYVVRQLQ